MENWYRVVGSGEHASIIGRQFDRSTEHTLFNKSGGHSLHHMGGLREPKFSSVCRWFPTPEQAWDDRQEQLELASAEAASATTTHEARRAVALATVHVSP